MIIIEIQGNAALITVKEDRAQAEQTYHEKLAYAAASSVPIHAVVMLNEYGERVKGEFYQHETD